MYTKTLLNNYERPYMRVLRALLLPDEMDPETLVSR